ncbi:tyrosine-type recombinase/integrase [Rhodococcus opacus]|uniref:tyrosine-type recombinase/integrase n=1 Tax=Rhodococcus opacus TaxID=37919 RepID=UPI000FFB2AF8|nr:tyrosine-type recombinase/integrase [Rhodococcus opacus]
MNLNELLERAGQQRELRDSTVASYKKFLSRIGVIDDTMSKEELELLLLDIQNINTRRSTAVAIRAVLGIKVKVPQGIPRRYVLPTENELRFALMQCKYETRGLLMMYGGLRLGEACAVTAKQLNGDRLMVDRQVLEFRQDGTNIVRLSPVKAGTGTVVVPEFLLPRIDALDSTDIPGHVRAAFHHWGRRHCIKLNPASLRHWHATWLLNRGVNIVAVSKQLRHSDPAITMRAYIDTNDDDIRKAFGSM